jgi:LysM repeat protein
VAGRAEAEPTVAKRTNSKSKSSLRASAKTANKTVHHKVRKGETLSSIAEDYNTTVTALRRNNKKLAHNIHAGDVLIVKTGQ